jgi:HD-GYP domain-containing protein (c-di-GMP phosphodiesterase class II)
MSVDFLILGDDERASIEAFMRLAAAADEFQMYAHNHATRVAKLADELAKRFHFGRVDRLALHLAALAHDLGKMAMNRDYIKRRAPLSEEERLDLTRHPVIAEQEAARAGADRSTQLIIRWHQEWWNGTGYPDALRGAQIPLAARILHVVESYSALTDSRPFRPARKAEEARAYLIEWAGLEFDPRVVHSFLALDSLDELRAYTETEGEAIAVGI